jgi:Tfp pilus assembly major pilin PilA
MFRASASNHRQHKHLTVDFAIDTRSINMLSLYKSSELQTKKNVLEYLETRPNTSSKKLRIKTNYTHCTYNFNAQVTDDFVQHPPLPTNNSVDNNEPVVDNQYPSRNTNS